MEQRNADIRLHVALDGSPAEEKWTDSSQHCGQHEHHEEERLWPSHLPGSRTVHSALQAIAPATPEERALMKIAKGCILIAFFAG